MDSQTATLAIRTEMGDNPVKSLNFETRISTMTQENEGISPGLSEASLRLSDLLRRSREGDPRAMEEIYEQSKRSVFNLAYRYTYNAAAAEDLLQDIFIKIFTHLQDVHSVETFNAWLYRIAVNTCYSYLRGKKVQVQRTIPLSEVEGRLEEATYDPPDAEVKKPLEEAIQTLPKKLKSVFMLHDVQGFKHEEIASMLGCSVGTSKSQLFKARMKLRNYLKAREYF